LAGKIQKKGKTRWDVCSLFMVRHVDKPVHRMVIIHDGTVRKYLTADHRSSPSKNDLSAQMSTSTLMSTFGFNELTTYTLVSTSRFTFLKLAKYMWTMTSIICILSFILRTIFSQMSLKCPIFVDKFLLFCKYISIYICRLLVPSFLSLSLISQ